MMLKVKFLKLSAGRPVAFLNKAFAEEKSIHVDDRIEIIKNSKRIIAVVDLVSRMLKKDEIALSTEISSELELKERELVNVIPALQPRSIPLILKKMNCQVLSNKEIHEIIADIVKNALTESEIAYFISSVYKCGMSMSEIKDMTQAIVDTGSRLKLKGKIVDKHSCGGIPGRTTPIVVSICAAAGLIMPKTSSRAITSPSGTADALEVLCNVNLSLSDIKKVVHSTGACLVWGGSLKLAPADDKIIEVERLMNLDSEPQLLASIMAKKLAVGSKYILIEIPYGKYAKFSKLEAFKLKTKFLQLAKSFHVKLRCVLAETREPLGNGIGPALEIRDVIKILKRESSCHLLESRALLLAGSLLELSGKVKKGKGLALAREILDSGRAYSKFKEIILAQGGKIRKINDAKFHYDILSSKSGRIRDIDIKKLNSIARILGCPSDKLAGMYLHKHLNQKVSKKEKIVTLYSESRQELKEGVSVYLTEHPIKVK